MASQDSIEEQARALTEYVAEASGKTHAFGTLTSSLYDTAWVAMIRKRDDKSALLFPECFQYVLDTQLQSGGWECCHFEIDGIMNTLGGLLALKRNSDIECQVIGQPMGSRIANAVKYLNTKLHAWDVGSCDYVGFEILVPSMLAFLEKEGLSFEFPGRKLLMTLNEKKISRIPASVWSGKIQTTITHSLEAFAGNMDFTGLADQLVFGAMGSSPSSTAAYLMYTPGWNEDAEEYLRDLVISRQKAGFRGLPGMYPTTGFEVLWIACTLLDNGFEVDTLDGIQSMIGITDEFYESLGGLVSGFSRMSVGDADDTARSIFIRNLLGKPTTPERLISTFEGPDHFLTYMFERHPSVTTNCNSLTTILEAPDMASYGTQIEKLVRYITAAWCDPDLVFADKWNVSEFYPIMLMCDCLVRLLYHWDQGHLPEISDELITEKVPLVLWQALMQTLQKQNPNGSYGETPSREITSYAIIALSNLASLPLMPQIRDQVDSSIEQARAYIRTASDAPEVEYIWIAKTTYSPLQISKAYVLAGLKAKVPKYSMGDKIRTIYNVSESMLQQSMTIFTSFGTLKIFPSWQVLGSLMEAQFFLAGLKKARNAMFDRKGMKKDDYLAFIPSTVCCANNLQRSFIKADILHDFMVLILRVYQLDEYMEHIVANELGSILGDVEDVIKEISQPGAFKRNVKRAVTLTKDSVTPTNGQSNGVPVKSSNGDTHSDSVGRHNGTQNGHSNGTSEPSLVHKNSFPLALSTLKDRLQSLVSSIVHHPRILATNAYNKQQLHRELRQCLLAHVTQIIDSRHAMQPDQDRDWLPQTSYHTWLRTTGSSHSCAPLSLAYLLCLISREQKQILKAGETYLVQDICMHLGNKARLENDRASYARDKREGNLNSLDFPEFGLSGSAHLAPIIDYERKCCLVAMDALRELGDRHKSPGCGETLEMLEFYLFLTDIYNDVYVMRDISCSA